MHAVALSATEQSALGLLTSDLQRIFGSRLQSIVAYGTAALTDAEDQPLHSLVLVDRLTVDDLTASAPLIDRWQRGGLATPLMLSREEFRRTLDVFPVEYGAIIDSHVLVFGADPFAGCAVCDTDMRRAIELQAKSHLIHLREGFLEASGNPDRISRLIAASVPAFRSLLDNLERLDPEAAGRYDATKQLVKELAAGGTIADPSALFARYIADVERLWTHVDAWRP